MIRALAFTITVAVFCRTAAAEQAPVTIVLRAKVEAITAKAGCARRTIPQFHQQTRARFRPPHLRAFTVGRGPDAQLMWQSERTGIENKWFALTGRVVAVKVEADACAARRWGLSESHQAAKTDGLTVRMKF